MPNLALQWCVHCALFPCMTQQSEHTVSRKVGYSTVGVMGIEGRTADCEATATVDLLTVWKPATVLRRAEGDERARTGSRCRARSPRVRPMVLANLPVPLLCCQSVWLSEKVIPTHGTLVCSLYLKESTGRVH